MSVDATDYAVGLAYIEEKNITSIVFQENFVKEIRNRYRNILHQTMKQYIQQKDWDKAFDVWEYCRERELFSPEFFLDAAEVEIARNNTDNAVKILSNAFDGYQNYRNDKFFERIGEILSPVKTPEAQSLALKAVEHSINLLINN
jgi:hypothetical protein